MSPVSVAAPPLRDAEAPVAPVLVAPAWLQSQLNGVTVIDTRPVADFLAGHIDGARSFPLDALIVEDSRSDALHHLAAAAARALANRGVRPTDHLVLVDAHDESAALGALVCELAGVRRVSILLGGFAAWRASGGATTDQLAEPGSVRETWSSAVPSTVHTASFEQLADAADHGSSHILDVRSQLEHEGIVGPPCCAARGSIPAALHLEWTSFFDLSGAPRLASNVRAMLAQVGIDDTDEVIVTCHSGRRAAAAAFVLRASGVRNVRVSIGSWHEWSLRRVAASAVDEGHGALLAHA